MLREVAEKEHVQLSIFWGISHQVQLRAAVNAVQPPKVDTAVLGAELKSCVRGSVSTPGLELSSVLVRYSLSVAECG